MQITEIDVRKPVEFNYARMSWADYVRMRTRAARIHIFLKDETVWENLEKRRVRPHTTYRKEVLPHVLDKMGLPRTTKVRWSQKAGCGCGCSPGFIVDGDAYGTTVYVTIAA